MLDLSKFAETLSELMINSNITAPTLAKALGCGRATINRYLKGNKMPSVDMCVRMADYFQCTIDFLIGVAEYNQPHTFLPCPPFQQHFASKIENSKHKKSDIIKQANLTESAFYNWLRGDTTPSIESLANIAAFLGCSIDELIGRIR